MPNFVKIGHTVAEIWQFNVARKLLGGHDAFSKFTNFARDTPSFSYNGQTRVLCTKPMISDHYAVLSRIVYLLAGLLDKL